MIDPPKTLKEARAYRYGGWAGNPDGTAYEEGKCAFEKWSGGRGTMASQCNRKNGHGPCGLFCKQHDPAAQAKRDKVRSDKWDTESKKRQHESDCIAALRGVSDPAAMLEKVREALGFYSNPDTYCVTVRSGTPIREDRGVKARAALALLPPIMISGDASDTPAEPGNHTA